MSAEANRNKLLALAEDIEGAQAVVRNAQKYAIPELGVTVLDQLRAAEDRLGAALTHLDCHIGEAARTAYRERARAVAR